MKIYCESIGLFEPSVYFCILHLKTYTFSLIPPVKNRPFHGSYIQM